MEPRGDATLPADEGDDGLRHLLKTRLDVAPTAWIAPGAVLVGDVEIAEGASVWYGCVLRGDLEPIRVGARSNVQDLTVIHVDHGQAVHIGEDVTIGHRCVIHGCRIEDGALIGMGAILLSGCHIGAGALVAAGAVVREDFQVPPGSIAAGVPAQLRGQVSAQFAERARRGVRTYVASAEAYRQGWMGGGRRGDSSS